MAPDPVEFTQADRDLVTRLLSRPLELPPAFIGYIVKKTSNDATITQSQVVSQSVYKDYVPTWTDSGDHASAFGNATVVAKYIQIGKHVHAMVSITFGSTSTFGTGNYAFAIPVTIGGGISFIGTARLYDSDTGNTGLASCAVASGTTINLAYGATYLGANTLVGKTAPWTWAQGDIVEMSILYAAA